MSSLDSASGSVGLFPCQAVEDPPCGDGVESEATLEIVGVVEAADPGSGLEDAEKFLYAPPPFVPGEDAQRIFCRRLAVGA